MTGDHVKGVACPKCRRETVVYNGNYYCDECSWAMPEAETPSSRAIIKAYLLQRLTAAQEAGNAKEIERMSFYLISGGYVEDEEKV